MKRVEPTLLLGCLAHLKANPFFHENSLEIVEKGALLIDGNGRIKDYGQRQDMLAAYPQVAKRDFGNAWILPGFVDGHVHFPQMDSVAAEAGTLMDWLTEKIYPAEAALVNQDLASALAKRFVGRLLASGTTTAMVFGSQYLSANRSLFEAAWAQGLNLMAGMTMMDCGAPKALCHSPEETYDQVVTLIAETSARQSLTYVITPRFALATTPEMLEVCKTLAREFPDCPIQTHINESQEEIAAVAEAYPWAEDYLAVYERAELLRPGTVLAHNIHPQDSELERLARTGAAVCHCPNSNLFLGSGLFPLQRHIRAGIPVLMGTDIGAGLRFCLLDELSEAYKVQKLQGARLDGGQLLYLATLGAQEALGRAGENGNFTKGKRADLVVVQPARDPDLVQRLRNASNGQAALFALIMMGGAHLIEETHVGGQVRYRNGAISN